MLKQRKKSTYRADGQEFFIRVAEATSQLEHGDQDEISGERPFPSVPISEHTKEDGANRSEEESERDSSRDIVSRVFAGLTAKLLGQAECCQRDCKVVVAIARPCKPSLRDVSFVPSPVTGTDQNEERRRTEKNMAHPNPLTMLICVSCITAINKMTNSPEQLERVLGSPVRFGICRLVHRGDDGAQD
jgi:hypothetical protein